MKTNGTRVTLLGSLLLLLPCMLLLTASGESRDFTQQDLKNYPELNEAGEVWCATASQTSDIVVIRDAKS